MRKKIKWYVVPICAVILSVVLRIISATPFFDSCLAQFLKEDKISKVKGLIDIINHLVVVVPLGIQSVVNAKNSERYKDIVYSFCHEQRELLFHTLKEKGYISGSCEDINIRIFEKHHNHLVLKDNKYLCTKEISGDLSFSIKKNEGLCTKAFTNGCSMLEIDNGSKDEFHLTERQKVLAGGLKFIVAVPIHSNFNGKIKTVICFDSFSKIAHEGSEEGILKDCETAAYLISNIIE